MELVFEIVGAQQFVPGLLTSKTFKQTGGTIGRAEDCDWVIPDQRRHLSNRHALVSHRDGHFYLTDTSSNGIRLKDSGAQLRKGEAQRIEHGEVYCLGDFEIRARLIRDPDLYVDQVGRPSAAGSIIPDDAFLDLDPLHAIGRHEKIGGPHSDDLDLAVASPPQTQAVDHARIDMASLPLPQLIPAPVAQQASSSPDAPRRQPTEFWQRFIDELGIEWDNPAEDECETLALNAARLLRQSIAGLQQSLRTRSELKNELRLAQTSVQGRSGNPLKHNGDSGEALQALLRPAKANLPSAEQMLMRAFWDLQAHQVALLSASRAAVRGALEHFAPEQLSLRFERDGQVTRLSGAAGRWRAFARYHRALRQDEEWSERLLARDFAQTYEEQVRLIATLNSDSRG